MLHILHEATHTKHQIQYVKSNLKVHFKHGTRNCGGDVNLCVNHLDSPARRGVAEGSCCCEGTPWGRRGRGRRVRRETGRGRRRGGTRVTGWGPWLEGWSRTCVVHERETGNLEWRMEIKEEWRYICQTEAKVFQTLPLVHIRIFNKPYVSPSPCDSSDELSKKLRNEVKKGREN